MQDTARKLTSRAWGGLLRPMSNARRPQWASYKVTLNTPDRLVVEYHPLAYLLLGGLMALLCLYAGVSSLAGGALRHGLLFTGAGLLFGAAFCGLFYHRITLTFDRATGLVTCLSRRIGRKSSATRPLPGLRAAFDTSFQGDHAMHRLLLIPQSGEPLRPTAALISGASVIAASETINLWLGNAVPSVASLDSRAPTA